MRGSGRAVLSCSMLRIASLSRAQERGHAAFVFGWTFGEETSSLYGAQLGAGLGGVYESFDSDPPSETSARNDFGINTSVGWSFK